jgi:hypothetical protein
LGPRENEYKDGTTGDYRAIYQREFGGMSSDTYTSVTRPYNSQYSLRLLLRRVNYHMYDRCSSQLFIYARYHCTPGFRVGLPQRQFGMLKFSKTFSMAAVIAGSASGKRRRRELQFMMENSSCIRVRGSSKAICQLYAGRVVEEWANLRQGLVCWGNISVSTRNRR